MSSRRMLLDTDILSAIMRNDGRAVERARAYIKDQSGLSFSVITRYEILRGLKAKDAVKQVEAFERLCSNCDVVPVASATVSRAAEIYANLRRCGTPIGDADILIAATALELGAGIVTNNTKHFERIAGLSIENWLRAPEP